MRIIWLGRPEVSSGSSVMRFAGKVLAALRKVIPDDEDGEGLIAICRWDEGTESWFLEEVFEESGGQLVWRAGRQRRGRSRGDGNGEGVPAE